MVSCPPVTAGTRLLLVCLSEEQSQPVETQHPLRRLLNAGKGDTLQIRSILPLVGLMSSLTVLGVPQQKEIKHVPIKPISAASGPEMYKEYCAVCHGMDGEGRGPAVEALKLPPPDLTTLAKMKGGKYPPDRVISAIQGDLRLPAHVSKEMPVWGVPFWRLSQRQSSEVQLRVTNLSKYVESLQAK